MRVGKTSQPTRKYHQGIVEFQQYFFLNDELLHAYYIKLYTYKQYMQN